MILEGIEDVSEILNDRSLNDTKTNNKVLEGKLLN